MGDVHPDTRPRTARRTLLLALLALCISLLLAGPAGAGPLTGGFSPTIVGGGADVDGNGDRQRQPTTRTPSTGTRASSMECSTATPGGSPPTTAVKETGRSPVRTTARLSATTERRTGSPSMSSTVPSRLATGRSRRSSTRAIPTIPDVFDSDFAWSARDGRVDSNGNELIDSDDCHVGVVDSIDVLSNDAGNSNPCGFASSPNTSTNGLLDFDNNQAVNALDSCSNGCFFGLDVAIGKGPGGRMSGLRRRPAPRCHRHVR